VSESRPFIYRFPDREIPNRTDSLTADHRGSGFRGLNCTGSAHRVRDSANADFLIREGEIAEEIAMGSENSREELEEI
jgi:hypothetical protein